MATPLNSQHISDLPEDDEVANIDAEVQRIYTHIKQLHEECASLLRRRNKLQASTCSLPSEILSLIFQHACPPANFFEVPYRQNWSNIKKPIFQFTLGAVSSHWRDVVLSTPQLWSSISKENSWYRNGFLPRWEEYFDAMFDRSNGTLVELALRDFDMYDDEPHYLSPKVDAILSRNQHRIESIRLEIDHVRDEWVSFLSNFTRLTTLSLTPSRDPSDIYGRTFTASTNLTISRFRLYGPFEMIRIDTPWITVTTLELSYIAVDACLKFLVGCPNLVEFRYFHPSSPEKPHDGTILTEVQALAKLETLWWTFLRNAVWNDDLFRYIRVPNLKTLYWDENHAIAQDVENAPGFLKDLPFTLKTLEFVEVDDHSCLLKDNLLQCINPSAEVERIMLKLCCEDMIETLFRILIVNADEGMATFPNLKNISIEWWERDSQYNPTSFNLETGELLVEILQSRWSGGYIDRFTFVANGVQRLDWEPSVIDDLYQLLDDGLDLVAIHNGVSLV